jgi:hypothetical protein
VIVCGDEKCDTDSGFIFGFPFWESCFARKAHISDRDVTRLSVKTVSPKDPEPMTETLNVIVSAWAARGRMRAEARSGSAKRALRMKGFPSRILSGIKVRLLLGGVK